MAELIAPDFDKSTVVRYVCGECGYDETASWFSHEIAHVDHTKGWVKLERFAEAKVGDFVRLIRPAWDSRIRYPEESLEDGSATVWEFPVAWAGTVTYVNPRGELILNVDEENPSLHFLSDGNFGDWFWTLYALRGK